MAWTQINALTALEQGGYYYSDYVGEIYSRGGKPIYCINGISLDELYVKERENYIQVSTIDIEKIDLGIALYQRVRNYDYYSVRDQYQYEKIAFDRNFSLGYYGHNTGYNGNDMWQLILPNREDPVTLFAAENPKEDLPMYKIQFKTDLKVGNRVCYGNDGTCEIVKIYEYADREGKFAVLKKICRFRENDKDEFDILWNDDNLYYVPYEDNYKVVNERGIFNKSKNELLLQPLVNQAGSGNGTKTINIQWKLINEAARYLVELYRYQEQKFKEGLYKLKSYEVDRNDGFLVISDLCGSGFIIKVLAENREGEIIAESRGIDEKGEPKFW